MKYYFVLHLYISSVHRQLGFEGSRQLGGRYYYIISQWK